MVNKKNIYPHDKYTENIYIDRWNQVKALQKIPQPQQRTPEWYIARENKITASAAEDFCGGNKYKASLESVVAKCGYLDYCDGPYTHHGKKFENLSTLIYSERNNIKVLEFGLLPHPKYAFIGSSPDGICSNKCYYSDKLNKLVLRMLEIKNPATRKIIVGDDIKESVPHGYFIQMQLQMDTCDSDECDFVQTKMSEYINRDAYIEDSHEDDPRLSREFALERGCMLQFLPRSKLNEPVAKKSYISDTCLYAAKFIYQPRGKMTMEELNEFITDSLDKFAQGEFSDESHKDEEKFNTNNYVFDRPLWWKMELYDCKLIIREPEFLKKIIPQLKIAWDRVLFYRANKKQLLELKEYSDKCKIKFFNKTKFVKYGNKIMDEHIAGGNLKKIIEKYVGGVTDKETSPEEKIEKLNRSLFLESDPDYDEDIEKFAKKKVKKAGVKKIKEVIKVIKKSFLDDSD